LILFAELGPNGVAEQPKTQRYIGGFDDSLVPVLHIAPVPRGTGVRSGQEAGAKLLVQSHGPAVEQAQDIRSPGVNPRPPERSRPAEAFQTVDLAVMLAWKAGVVRPAPLFGSISLKSFEKVLK
jgi:hypothetical protein